MEKMKIRTKIEDSGHLSILSFEAASLPECCLIWKHDYGTAVSDLCKSSPKAEQGEQRGRWLRPEGLSSNVQELPNSYRESGSEKGTEALLGYHPPTWPVPVMMLLGI